MPRNLHIIGPFNTGTNLLFNIINNSNCIDLSNTNIVSIEDVNLPFLKHTLDISTIDKYLSNPDNLLVIMYKDIYNWLYSIKKECYDLKYKKLYLPVELYGKKFPNVIELYNFYYINYMSLLKKYNNAIFLDYEKVIDVNTSYNYINNKLNTINLHITDKTKFDSTLMTESKSHGSSVKNANEAKQKYSINNLMVKHFVSQIPKLNQSIKHILFEFYKNNEHAYL